MTTKREESEGHCLRVRRGSSSHIIKSVEDEEEGDDGNAKSFGIVHRVAGRQAHDAAEGEEHSGRGSEPEWATTNSINDHSNTGGKDDCSTRLISRVVGHLGRYYTRNSKPAGQSGSVVAGRLK